MNFFPEETNGIVKIAILSFQKLAVPWTDNLSCPICPLEIFALTLYVHACCEAVHLCWTESSSNNYIYIYIELFTSTCHETPEGKDCDCFQYIGAPTEQRGKISSKPHTSYFIQFLGRGKNEKNRLPLRLWKSHQKER